jgi:hypothetical protein
MASNVLTGAYRVFFSTYAWTAANIDSAVGGTIPNSVTWKQIFTNGEAKITISRDLLDLQTDQEGIRKRIINGVDKVEVEIPIADISYETIVKYFQINPTDVDTSDGVKALKGSYRGTEITNSFSILLYHTSYDPSNLTDTPKLGTGSDPTAILLFKVVSASGLEISYNPSGQQILTLKLQALSVDGADNKGVLGVVGTLSSSS